MWSENHRAKERDGLLIVGYWFRAQSNVPGLLPWQARTDEHRDTTDLARKRRAIEVARAPVAQNPAIRPELRFPLADPTPADQLEQHHDDCQYQQKVHKAADCGSGDQAQGPKHDENNCNCE